jgi:hypothetical protein
MPTWYIGIVIGIVIVVLLLLTRYMTYPITTINNSLSSSTPSELLQTVIGNFSLGAALNSRADRPTADKDDDAEPNSASSTVPWCLIGELNGRRGCAKMADGGQCMSNQVFSSRELCLKADPTGAAEPAVKADPTGAAEPAVKADPTGAAEPAVKADPTGAAEPAVKAPDPALQQKIGLNILPIPMIFGRPIIQPLEPNPLYT